MSRRDAVTGRFVKGHGLCKTSEYIIWGDMCWRCKCPTVKNYGEKGIAVCDRWRNSFLEFLSDMGPRPSPKHTIDRIDSNGDYEPGNCRWATWKEQMNNCSFNRKITFDGVTMTVTQWSERLGIKKHTIFSRLYRGSSVEEVLTIRDRRRKVL